MTTSTTKADSQLRVVHDPRDLYLDLLKGALTRSLFPESRQTYVPSDSMRRGVYKFIEPALRRRGFELVLRFPYDAAKRESGRDWPPEADTMVGHQRLENLQRCVTDVISNNVPGDLIETGVWRGGSSIFMRAILAAYGVSDRTVWVADSFEGLPKPDDAHVEDVEDALWSYSYLAVSQEQVEANFAKYGLLDEHVRFLKGWFCDTLPAAPIERLAVMRLDGDLYESTADAFHSLYPKLSVGGYVIIDDYRAVRGCYAAVADLRAEYGITDPIIEIDGTGAYWQRTS